MSSTLRPQPAGRPSPPHRPTPTDHPLRQRLAALRRQLRFVALFRGSSWLAVCLLATLLAVGLLDYRVHLPGLVRAFALAGLLAGTGLILYRQLVRPLAIPDDDLSLALRIEERYPLLNDALASTVEFLDRTAGPDGESDSMRREAVRRALVKIHGLDFNRVVDARGVRQAGFSAAVAAAAAVLLSLLFPALAATAVARLANPFAAIDWPKKTRIELDSVPQRIGRNKELKVSGTLAGVIPKEATVEVSHEGFPVQRKALAVHPEKHTFNLHLRPEEVQRNFRFRILANDAATPEYPVEVLALPVFVNLDGKPSPQIQIDLPAYTDLPSPQVLSPGQGNLDVIAGSVVSFRAATDRPLRRAWLEYQPETQGALQAVLLAPLGHAHPLGAVSGVALGMPFTRRIPARIEGDGRQFSATFQPCVHGQYAIHFEDETDLESSRTYELRLRLDPAPVVRLERPAPSRDSLSVLPTAELPLQVVVEDVQYAVRSAWLEYRTRPEEQARRLPLFHHAEGSGGAAPWAGLSALTIPRYRLRMPLLNFDRILPVRLLRHADGSALKDGDTVLLQACADDFDDVSAFKEPGRSHVVTIRIVTRDALEAELNREQGKIQKDLVELRDKQREALAKIKEIEQRAKKGERMVPEREAAEAEATAQKLQQEAAAEEEKAEKAPTEAQKQEHLDRAKELKAKALAQEQRAQELKRQAQQLAEAEQIQQQIREKLGNEREGLRGEVERIRETLRQNNMQNSNAMDRMSRVARDLDRLAEKELEQIEPKLTNARKMAELEDPQTRQERRAELERRAKQEEQEARAAEQAAEKLDERAAAAEKAAAEAGDERERTRRAEEGKRLRQEAEAQKQKAAEKRAQAERDRQDASDTADPARARQALAEARRGQEQVDRSLSNLLQDLEPWSSTLEVTGETNRLVQEQKELQARLEELQQKGLTGKSREELAEMEKSELDSLQDAQRRLQERTASLLQQMKKVAEARAEKDPDTARDLNNAVTQAEQHNPADAMREAQEQIGGNKLEQARKKQEEALAELEKMQRNLKDSREARLDRLARKMREAEQKVEELIEEQERLKKKMREAENIADPMKRDEELKRLAQKQGELREKTNEVMKQLSRLGNDRAREAVQEAGEEMKDAVQQLSRGKRDEAKQDEVLDRLEEARKELERERKKAEEELGREQLVRVADVIRRIRERQEGHGQEGKRLQDAALERKGWSRGLRQSLLDLGRNQKGIAEETAGVAKKDLSAAPVFAKLLNMAGEAMTKAGDRASTLARTPPELEALPDAELKRLQEEALRRLDQLLTSLKEATDDPRPLSRQGGEPGEGDDPAAGGPQGDDSLPPLAQLKLLRSLQKEVNDRTEAFRKANPDPEKLGPKEKAELEGLRREQKEVADLLERLTRPPGDPGDDPAKDGDEADEKKDGNPGEKK